MAQTRDLKIVRIPANIHKKVKDIARNKDRHMEGIVRDALEAYIDAEKQKRPA